MSGADFHILARYFGVPARKRAKTPQEQALDKALAAERRKGYSAMRKAKALALQHGVDIERESAVAYWVTCDAFAEGDAVDPCEGEHFCSDGFEVLAAVEAYAKALAAKG